MKIIPITLPFFAIFLTFASSTEKQTIAGSYKGVIWSVDRDQPGSTVLKVSASGKVTGTYVYQDQGKLEKGTIENCKQDKRILFCIWHDKYGSGDWRVKFARDFKSFSGHWFDNKGGYRELGPSSGHRWDGIKSD